MNKQYKIIDLFAGIGGIRLGFEKTGRCKTVFSSEIDKYACQTYKKNFGDDPYCDLTKVRADEVPNFDILLAGFPCQAFSIAGKKGGFEDTRGTLFFDVARIIKAKKPAAFLLENVKGLVMHDNGRTLQVICNALTNDLKYSIQYKILNSKNFGVPQNRERIYIVGFRKDLPFSFPAQKKKKVVLEKVLENKEVSSKYYLSQRYLNSLKEHKQRHENKGNGFGYEIMTKSSIANAIVVGGMGKERNLLIDKRLKDFAPKTNIKGKINSSFVRRMTPREWARLQGYPDSFKIPVSDTQAYKQFGNSVTVPLINALAIQIIETLDINSTKATTNNRRHYHRQLEV